MAGVPQRGRLTQLRLEQHVGADHDQHDQHDRLEGRPAGCGSATSAPATRAREREHHHRQEGPRVRPDPAVVRRRADRRPADRGRACWSPGSASGAACGSPSSSAGSWISPPPPTTASTNPAASGREPEQDQHGQRRVVHRGHPRVGRVRIVSLLPSTTEILFALGAGDDVVGVTFECDTPAEARTRTIVSTSAMPAGLTPAEIDAYVVGAVARGETSTTSRPTRCAPRPHAGGHPGPVRGLRGRRHHRRRRARPPGLHGRGADRRPAHARGGAGLGAAARQGHRPRGRRDRAGRGRCGSGWPPSGAARIGRRRPRVAVLEWTDPPYAPGHWIPEMVELAGGENVLGAAGQKSVRITWDDVAAARPDVVVVAPVRLRPRRRPGPGRRAGRRACCPPASASTRSTPTACGPAPARGSSTASRSWPQCSDDR